MYLKICRVLCCSFSETVCLLLIFSPCAQQQIPHHYRLQACMQIIHQNHHGSGGGAIQPSSLDGCCLFLTAALFFADFLKNVHAFFSSKPSDIPSCTWTIDLINAHRHVYSFCGWGLHDHVTWSPACFTNTAWLKD